MELLQSIWDLWLLIDEPLGTVIGVVIVLCLIRENLWAWPLGVIFVFISITVLVEAKLYANLALHLIGFLPLNLYGWYMWIFGGDQRDELPVTRSTYTLLGTIAIVCVAGGLIFGFVFSNFTDAALPYWDNAIFMMSFGAMYLTANKKIENWVVWLAVNLLSVPIYFIQGMTLYSGLYVLYIGMAVWGFIEWRKSMLATQAHAVASK